MTETTSKFVRVGDAEIHVFTEGSGSPILVPTGCGIEFYRRTFSRRLTGAHSFVYVEMRGTGASTGSPAGATYATLADDLDVVRDNLGIDRAVVLGHSNHGGIALEFGLRHPEHAAAVVSVASVPDFSRAMSVGIARWEAEANAERKELLGRKQAELRALDTSVMDPDELALRQYLALHPLVWKDPALDAGALWGGVPKGFALYMQSVIRPEAERFCLVPSLGKIPCSVLALSGRYDYVCPVELWSEVIDTLPRGRLDIFEQSGHNPQFEEPDRFDAVLLEFLRTLS
ncbi:alpha/beta hydrolase [Polyangium sp. y55x31]|uniref:alpha/beta fold hydrolase n=1 Tax=Polyangium sp. y55x31 TaxID=3042688 RepID=UPI0024827AE9|nr:alpha/beta hydrolase [Polyangium sp. y55x31]MDI1479788.1 alpha/beta hydrolase [Polyangium sp. y55x31]